MLQAKHQISLCISSEADRKDSADVSPGSGVGGGAAGRGVAGRGGYSHIRACYF